MISYHFPIVVGGENQRIVMVHLFPQKEDPPKNDTQIEDSPKQEKENINPEKKETEKKDNDNKNAQTAGNDISGNGYQENRVIFTNSLDHLFGIKDNFTLVCSDGTNHVYPTNLKVPSNEGFNNENIQNRTDTNQTNVDAYSENNFQATNTKAANSQTKNPINKVLDKTKKAIDKIKNFILEQPEETDNSNKSVTTDNTHIPVPNNITTVNVTTSRGTLSEIKKGGYSFFNLGGFHNDNVLITLTFNFTLNNEEKYIGTLRLLYTNAVKYITIDLGSDVTQTNVSTTALRNTRPNLIKTLKGKYEVTDKSTYYAQNHDADSSYYRTGNILFRKDGEIKADTFPQKDEDYINYLSLTLEGKNQNAANPLEGNAEDFMRFPNIKVLYSNRNLINQLNLFQPKDIELDANSFIDVMSCIYKRIVEVSGERAVQDQQPYNYSILLLMPNIYRQIEIDKLLYDLNKIYNGKTNGSEQTSFYDFRAISESDAAFLGNEDIVEEKTRDLENNEQKDMFLTIDAGKGTTDFSLISRSDNGRFTPLLRGGITGAGGCIDTLFAAIYAKHIYANCKNSSNATIKQETANCDEEKFVNNFMEWFYHLPDANKEKMSRMIEHMKTTFNESQGTCDWHNFFIEDKGITNIINRKYESSDNEDILKKDSKESTLKLDEKDFTTIKILCRKIAFQTINLIKGMSNNDLLSYVDFVLLTGRAFAFTPLQKAFEKEIEILRPRGQLIKKMKKNKSLKTLQIISPDNFQDTKTKSIEFVNHNLKTSLNSDLCCLPDLLRDADLEQKNVREPSMDIFFDGISTTGGQRWYIGYDASTSDGFIPSLGQGAIGQNNQELFRLTNWTLFPLFPMNNQNQIYNNLFKS